MRTIFCLLLFFVCGGAFGQNETWTPEQLMAPADLAATIQRGGAQPLVICVGPSGPILASVETGPAHEKANLEKLRAMLEKESRDKEVVIYCGCCPFDRCPNIRPAMTLLREMHFKHARLLNLVHNVRTDWIAPGYPVKK